MKIGILTYHRALNDGSILQTYCSQEFLKHHCKGCEVEVIDYMPRKMYKNSIRRTLSKKIPFIRIGQIKRLRQVRKFNNVGFQLSKKRIITDNLQKACDFVEKLSYDVICVGSDTVWRVWENEFNATAPNIYFLPFKTKSKKIGLAVSCDRTDRELLRDQVRVQKISKYLADFDFISARDQAAVDYLQWFGIPSEKIYRLCDPTVLWDFTNIIKSPLEEEFLRNNRIAGVSIDCRVHREKVAEYLRSKGYVVYNLMSGNVAGTKRIDLHNSFEQRLGFYRHIDLLVTDRFHGSIMTFVISDNAPVILLEIEENYPETNSKGRDLFQQMGIESMVYRLSKKNIDIKQLEQKISEWPFKEDEVQMKLACLREKSQDTVNKMLAFINKP